MLPVLSLVDIQPGDRRNVGGKAIHLARMHRGGLPIPAAVVIPVTGLRRALEHAGLWERAEEVARTGVVGDLSDAISTMALPPGWR